MYFSPAPTKEERVKGGKCQLGLSIISPVFCVIPDCPIGARLKVSILLTSHGENHVSAWGSTGASQREVPANRITMSSFFSPLPNLGAGKAHHPHLSWRQDTCPSLEHGIPNNNAHIHKDDDIHTHTHIYQLYTSVPWEVVRHIVMGGGSIVQPFCALDDRRIMSCTCVVCIQQY